MCICQEYCGLTATHRTQKTGEKSSFLMFGFDCHHPTEAATLPPKFPNHTDISDFSQQLILSLLSARALAKKSLSKAQQIQKAGYEKTYHPMQIENWRLDNDSFSTRRNWKVA